MAASRHIHLFTVGDTTPVELDIVDSNGRKTPPSNVLSARLVLRETPTATPLIDLPGTITESSFTARPTQAQADALTAGIFLGQVAIETAEGTLLSDMVYIEVEDRVA